MTQAAHPDNDLSGTYRVLVKLTSAYGAPIPVGMTVHLRPSHHGTKGCYQMHDPANGGAYLGALTQASVQSCLIRID